jgi:hypothetical protein
MAKVREVRRFGSLEEAFSEAVWEPFLVHRPKEFTSLDFEEAVSRLKSGGYKVSAFDEFGTNHLGLDVKDLLEHWENDQLKLAILDSWIHVFDLPEDLVRYHHVVPEDDPSHAFMGQTLVLSRANGYTYLHHDPYKYGGGWMYLHEGQKAWHYLDPKWMPYIFSDEDKNVQDLLPEDAGKLIPSELLDEVEFLTATAKAGDFLYWPPSWMHRVWTHEKSLGVGGYIRREEWPEHVNKLTKIL